MNVPGRKNDDFPRLSRNYSMDTDWYEFMMDDTYELCEEGDVEVTFDIFFRKVPDNGGYAVMAGNDLLTEFVKDLQYTAKDIEFLRWQGLSEKILEQMKTLKFTGTIKAIPDGTPIFPNEPLVTVTCPILQANLIEAPLLSLLNGAIEHTTAARRIVEATPKNVPIADFSLRRTPHPEDGFTTSISAIIAGFTASANSKFAEEYNLIPNGTTAHSFIQFHDTEEDAMEKFGRCHPERATFIVDTYGAKRGIENAIKTFKELEKAGYPTDKFAIRLDSGNLLLLSRYVRKELNKAGLPQVKICVTDCLDAKKIKRLFDKKAPIDLLGVGTNIAKAPSVGLVYKLVAKRKLNEWEPKIKLSDTIEKAINPGRKRVFRAFDKKTGLAKADVIVEDGKKIDENNLIIFNPQNGEKQDTINDFDLVELQKPVFVDGELVYEDPTLLEKRDYCEQQMKKIPEEIRREYNPEQYKVSGTEEYVEEKFGLIKRIKDRYTNRKGRDKDER